MIRLDQRGVLHILVPIVLLIGIIAGVYLVQNTTKLFPKALIPAVQAPQTSFSLSFINISYPYILGEEVAVKILIHSDIASSNLFSAKINYDPSQLKLERIDKSGSFITNWVEEYFNEPGKISLVGGVPNPGIQTKVEDSTVMATLYFKALKVGKAIISFDDSSAIYSNADNINILTSKEPQTVAIAASRSGPPDNPMINNEGFEIGMEAGAQSDTGKVDLVRESGAKWVRLNFIGSNWTQGSSDVVKYNNIVNAYTQKGIKILGLIGAESVAGGYDRSKPDEFAQKYQTVSDDIISQFGDRVKTYELFNEPNDWAGGQSSQMSPRYFAKNLAKIYQQIKITKGKKDITLISGPLFSADITTASDYLSQTYTEGKLYEGWEQIKSSTGSYPLDGVGYHLYVAQGMGDQGNVESKINQNLNDIKNILSQFDPNKKVWISEVGWGTGEGRVTEEVQASNLKKAFGVLKSGSDVAVALWFTLEDFDETQWGLIRGDGAKKKAWFAFKEVTGVPSSSSTPTPTPSSTPISWCSACRADIIKDNDNVVNIFDMVRVSSCFNAASSNQDWENKCKLGDINKDNKVDISDLNCIKDVFNQKCVKSTPGSGDGNKDGKVDLIDLSILLTDFNKNGGFRTGIDLNGDGVVNTFDFSLMRNLLIEKGIIAGNTTSSNETSQGMGYLDQNGKVPTEDAIFIATINPDMYLQYESEGLIANPQEVRENEIAKNRLEEVSYSKASPQDSRISRTAQVKAALLPIVSSCGEITTGGDYTVTQDLVGNKDIAGDTNCIYIHDTSNVNLDCQNHTLTGTPNAWYDAVIHIENVTNFSIKNCSVRPTRLSNAMHIAYSNVGTIQNNKFFVGVVDVLKSNNLQVLNNSFDRGIYQQYGSSNNQINSNTLVGDPTRLGSFLISSGLGSNNKIQNNILDGKWDGTIPPTGVLGVDDDIVIGPESQSVVSGNVISNNWDCGIETDGLVQDTLITNNQINNAANCGIGGWYWSSWLRNTVSSNTVNKSFRMFSFFRAFGLIPGEQYVYFKDNTFSNNVFTNQFSSDSVKGIQVFRLHTSDIVFDQTALPPTISQSNLRLGNNLFINNDFDGLSSNNLSHPYFTPASASVFVDGGGNKCLAGNDPSTQMLDCNGKTTACTRLKNLITASFWGTCGDGIYNPRADINQDGYVNGLDTSKLIGGSNGLTDQAVCNNYLNNSQYPCKQ